MINGDMGGTNPPDMEDEPATVVPVVVKPQPPVAIED